MDARLGAGAAPLLCAGRRQGRRELDDAPGSRAAIADNLAYVNRVVGTALGGVSGAPLVFLGFSQGVAMAYRAAILGAHRSVASSPIGGDVPPDVKGLPADRFPPILIAGGESDEWYTAAKLEADEVFLRESRRAPRYLSLSRRARLHGGTARPHPAGARQADMIGPGPRSVGRTEDQGPGTKDQGLFAHGLPQLRLGLRRGGGVHVDVAIEVQIELLENRNQRLDVIVGRLPRRRQREVALEEHLLLGDVRDHQAVRVRHRRDVVHLDGARPVRVDLLLRHRFDLRLLRILRERVVQQRSRRVERFLEELLVVLLRDDRGAFGHQRRQPAGVIGVRMRVHHVADRLVGDQLLRFGDVGERRAPRTVRPRAS